MKILSALLLFSLLGFPVAENASAETQRKVSIEGHRGARGHLPENTIPSFLLALDQGADTLEMDVVISSDKKVVVSHEPWFSSAISLDPTGQRIPKEIEREHIIYQMKYSQVVRYDVGSIGNAEFPQQRKEKAVKPLLEDVIKKAESHAKSKKLPPVSYSIEIKSDPKGDRLFHPEPAEFAKLVVDVITKQKIDGRSIIQSFDVRALQAVKEIAPNMPLALLVSAAGPPQANLDKLGFTPNTYSPNFSLVNEELIRFCREKGMRIVPWTVNEIADLEKMAKFDIDGIISDYPDRAVQVFRK
ncbi:MAG: glycerophosphodiester phosphodiesterase [Acidobacteriota bacterium]|nr:MAG: glycerophosphodiester phosphodiesterase [Acidobacteriota bacterium]